MPVGLFRLWSEIWTLHTHTWITVARDPYNTETYSLFDGIIFKAVEWAFIVLQKLRRCFVARRNLFLSCLASRRTLTLSTTDLTASQLSSFDCKSSGQVVCTKVWKSFSANSRAFFLLFKSASSFGLPVSDLISRYLSSWLTLLS